MCWLAPGGKTSEAGPLPQMINALSRASWGTGHSSTPSLWMQVEEAEVLQRCFIYFTQSSFSFFPFFFKLSLLEVALQQKSFETSWKLCDQGSYSLTHIPFIYSFLYLLIIFKAPATVDLVLEAQS